MNYYSIYLVELLGGSPGIRHRKSLALGKSLLNLTYMLIMVGERRGEILEGQFLKYSLCSHDNLKKCNVYFDDL